MNLAVFLPGWIGDAVMATPALRALRTHFDDARLIGVLKPYVADVFAGGDWLDHVILSGGRAWSQGVAGTAWQLRRQDIDLAVLFPNSFRSALIAWLGGCRRRVGYARYGRAALLTEALEPIRDEAGRLKPSPVIDAYNRLAEQMGCPRPGYVQELFTTPADEAGADRVWEQAGLDDYPEVVCLNPGAAFGSAKYWPTSYFGVLARRLTQERGSAVLVLCGPSERAMCRSIAALAGQPAVHALANLTAPDGEGPPLNLGLLKACIRRADLLVTTDSGPRHFAAAFDRPVITLFGPTHIAWTETYHPRAVHLQQRVDCGPCQKRVCPYDHRCMLRLTPEEVFTTAEGLLH
jgi:heptosyltransferase-2